MVKDLAFCENNYSRQATVVNDSFLTGKNLNGSQHAHVRTRIHARGLFDNWPQWMLQLSERFDNECVMSVYASDRGKESTWGMVARISADGSEWVSNGMFENPDKMGFAVPVMVGLSNVLKFMLDNSLRRAVIFVEHEWLIGAIKPGSRITVAGDQADMLRGLREMASGLDISLHLVAPSDNYPARSLSMRHNLPVTLPWAAFPTKR